MSTWKPSDYTPLSPYLITEQAQEVIDFLVATVGAAPLRRFEAPDGEIMHAEVAIDGCVVMLGQAGEAWSAVPCHLHLYVPDVDATYERALRNGATSVDAPSRRDGDADRRCGVLGPGGNTWWFATQIEQDSGEASQ